MKEPFVRTKAADKDKKTDVAEHPRAMRHVGLLFNNPPGSASCHLSSRPKAPSTKDSLTLSPTLVFRALGR